MTAAPNRLPARLEPTPLDSPGSTRWCGHGGCPRRADFILNVAGHRQCYCCPEHGQIGLDADRNKPGTGWVSRG